MAQTLDTAVLVLLAIVSGILSGVFFVAQSMVCIWLLFGFLSLFRGGIRIWFNGWGNWRPVLGMSLVLNVAASAFMSLVLMATLGSQVSMPAVFLIFALAWLATSIAVGIVLKKYVRG